MTSVYQLSELNNKKIPEFLQFYRHFPQKYPFLLTTSKQIINHKCSSTEIENRYDILFIEPDNYLKMDHSFTLSCSNKTEFTEGETFLEAFEQEFLSEKRSHIVCEHTSDSDNTSFQPPFSGGWFVFLAYELAQQIEPTLKLTNDASVLPIACAARVKKALIYDHYLDKYFFITEKELDHQRAYQALLNDINHIQQANHPVNKQVAEEFLMSLSEELDEQFLASAHKVHHYIKEGDVFQVNLSRRWQAYASTEKYSETACALATSLGQTNPAPFSGFASFVSAQGQASIISSSPERLLKVHNNQLESRPIAGTRPRSECAEEDDRLLKELHDHPKEQAEHIMLIDLIRNDLGRVCQPGTVRVDELMTNESYTHVHHIVSNVIGQLKADATPSDVIKALFPGGTITGCPKVRCMEIIAELEPHSRGAYTGSMGYINRDGSMDLNILIRTIQLEQASVSESMASKDRQTAKQRLTVQAGAGLVYDSIATKELMETRTKAKGILNALENRSLKQ